MPRKASAKKRQATTSKKEASNVNASSKNRPPNPKRNAPASKRKSSGNSIDALVKKQLASLKQADTFFKDAVSIVEIYRKKHPELDQYIPSVESTQPEIKVRGASSEDSNSHFRFHIEVVDGDPRYWVALDQEEPSYLDHSAWQKQFHLRLAKTIAGIAWLPPSALHPDTAPRFLIFQAAGCPGRGGLPSEADLQGSCFCAVRPVGKTARSITIGRSWKIGVAEPIALSNKRFSIWERLMTASKSSGFKRFQMSQSICGIFFDRSALRRLSGSAISASLLQREA
jgi:hypothetical protein